MFPARSTVPRMFECEEGVLARPSMTVEVSLYVAVRVPSRTSNTWMESQVPEEVVFGGATRGYQH
jgi:hypothetical protein